MEEGFEDNILLRAGTVAEEGLLSVELLKNEEDILEFPDVTEVRDDDGIFSETFLDTEEVFPRPDVALLWADAGRPVEGLLFVGAEPPVVLLCCPLAEEGLGWLELLLSCLSATALPLPSPLAKESVPAR